MAPHADPFEHIAWLRQRLGAACEHVAVQGDQPLVLDDPRYAFVTLSEHHQLFCVGYRDRKPHGRREHLAVCRPGQLVLGVTPAEGGDGTALLMSGLSGSVVWRVPFTALAALNEAPDSAKILGRLFEGWIALLIESLPSAASVPTRARAVTPGETVEIVADSDGFVGAPLRAGRGLCWIAPPRPPSLYAGIPTGRLGVTAECWPLGGNGWALCGAGKLRIWSTAELLGNDPTATFAQGFAGLVLAIAGRRRGELERHRLGLDRASLEAEGTALSASLGKLARVGRAERLTRALSAGGSDPGRALAVVHEALNVPPPNVDIAQSERLSQVQSALARSTGARSRPVLLEERWWGTDNGPLLGFVMKDEPKAEQRIEARIQAREAAAAQPAADEALRAVALLPGRGGYAVYDPALAGKPPRNVVAGNAEQIHPQAHQFYRPLPLGPVGPLDLARFLRVGAGRDTLVVAVIGALVGLLALLIPLLTGVVFDRIVPGAERGLLIQLVLVLSSVYAGATLFDAARGLALVRMQTRLDAGLEAAIWDRLLRLPLPFFRRYSAGDLAARAAGIGAIREALAGATLSSILGGIFSSWNLFMLFVLDARLALAALGLVTVAAIVTVATSARELAQRRQLTAFDGRLGGLLLQLVGGIAKLRVARGEKRAFGVWANLFAKRRSKELALEGAGARFAVFQAVYPIVCTAVLFFLIASGEAKAPGASTAVRAMSTGQFLAFYAAFGAFLRGSLELLGAVLGVVAVLPLYERAKPILQETPEKEGGERARIELSGKLELSHVSFRYYEEGPLVLDDVSLSIEPGQFVAIVGASGSGKSTLLRILLGFETPSEGGVFFDGQALGSLDVRAVRQQIGVVLQNSDIMSGDIYTNIVGSTGRSLEEAWVAARQAAFDKDLEAMPMGMHTVLSQGGGTLSGGQRQRLLIARALVARPKILFFDEATSALDNETQAIVAASLDGLQVTRVVIAHRLSTIQHADKIVVLSRGRIVEAGRFEELMAKDGAMSALARRQMI